MPWFHPVLVWSAVGAIALWVTLSVYLLLVERRRDAARTTLSAALAALESPEVLRLSLAERATHLRPVLESASRELVMRAIADPHTPAAAAAALEAYLIDRWGQARLERDAASHRTSRDKWRRMAALRILFRFDHARRIELGAEAVKGSDADVASVALSLLGGSDHPDAVEVLLDALKRRQHPGTRIAVQLDRSPQHLGHRLRSLLTDADPVVRRWSATLLGRYSDVDGLERDLAQAAQDVDPRVRKAAIQSLGAIGETLAAETARRLLNDPVPFVRAAAVRAISALERDDLAEDVAARLGDRDWWVRFAAKQCLEQMGPDIWPILVRLLDDPDRFVRNSAAEVFQNIGVLDSFIVMEAATADPADRRVDLLRRIAAAGGLRLTDSLLERAGPRLAPRIRHLLSTIGLEHVGAA
jgi:HEAT repeat protein